MMSPTVSGLVALFLFSLGTLLVSLSGDIPPFQLSAMVFLSCALTLWLYFKKAGKDIRRALNAPLSQYVVMLVGVGGYQVLLNVAFKVAPPFEVNMLNYLWPILLVIFTKAMHKQMMCMNELIGMVLGFCGVCLIFMPQNGAAFMHIGLGHGLIVLGAVLWAYYSAYVSGKHFSVMLLIPVTAITGLISLVIHFLFEDTVLLQPWHVWLAVGIFCATRFSYALWDYGMRKGDQMLLTSLSYFLPLLSSIYFIGFGILPSSVEVATGGACIVLGCLIVNMHRIKLKKVTTSDPL